MRKLILLTHQYPRPYGDAPFVEAEITALAAEFDDIAVFSFDPRPLEGLPVLPPNVRFVADLYRERVGFARRAIGFLRAIPRTVDILERERQAGRRLPWHPSTRAVLAATKVAGQHALLREIHDPAPESITLYTFWGMGAALGVPWLPRPSGGVIVRLHGYDLVDTAESQLPLRASLLHAADRVLFVSQNGKTVFQGQAWVGERETQLVVAPLGTPSFGLSPAPPKEGSPIIVSCSSLTTVKRVPLIAQALRLLAERRPVHWIHLGDGPDMPDVKSAVEAGPQGLTCDLRGQVTREEVIATYSLPISAFVNASSSEGLPVSLMEAVSAGVPCVATDVGGTAELVGERYGTGLLVPADVTAEQLAVAIDSLLSAPLDRHNVRRHWAQHFDRDQTGPRAARILKDLAEGTS